MSSEEVLGHLCDSLQQAKSAQLNVKYYSWKYACCVALLPKSGYLHYKGMMAMAPVSSKAIHIWDITYRKEGAEPFCLSEALGSVLKKVYFKDYLIQGAQEHVNRTLGPSYKNMDLDTKITMVNAELEKAPKPQEHLIGNNFDAKYFWPQRPWLDELKRLRREKGKMVMVGQAKQLLALRHHAAELLVLLPTRAGNVRAARDSLAQLGTGLPETQLPAVITQFPEAELTQLPSDMENMQAAVSALQVASSDINQVPDIRDMGTDQAPATEATAVQGPEADLTQPPDAVEDLVTEVPAADMADLQNTQTDFVNAPGMGDMGTDQAPATEATAVQGPEADLTQPPDAVEDLVTEVPAADMADLQNTQTDFVNAPGMGDMGTDQAPATEATAVQGPEADLTQPPDAVEDLVTEVPAADMADLQNTQTDFVNAPGMGDMGTDLAPATEATAVQGPEADLTQPPDAMEELGTHLGNSCQGVTVMGQKGGQVASSSGAGASCHLASTFMVGISADNTGGLTMGDSRASGSQGSGAHVNHSRHSIQLRQRVMTRAVARAVQEGNGTGHGMKRKAADPLESSGNQKIKQSKAPCAKTVEAEGVLRVEDDDDKDDYKTIESTVYRVYSLADVPAALARHGIVIIQVHSLKDTVGPKQLQMALRFAQKNAAPIFQDIPRDEDGNFIPERDMSGTETNFLISDFGTGQRRQIILDGPHPEILADFRGVVERELDMLRTKIMGGQTLHMNQPAILINTQTARQKPVSRQCWHTDLSEGQTGFVAIAAVQKFSLLVFPGSHIEVQECWRLQDLVQKGVISEASFKACLASHSFTAVRIYLDLGDILFMSGHTIHAGDRGTDKHPALRMHWYITDEEKRNETSQIVLYGDDFANRFR
ncbi:hypothetical protein Vretimale_13670 [Volvox reticuliferus]|uniref:Uncharacterized protein n=1 Tax=Volvox reticuliferus TaxID=1737510 RepID=A0A8J4GMT5_9CHLO|nr:hypothetical protein Vretimale_13670 [Volvox reticuliferus]